MSHKILSLVMLLSVSRASAQDTGHWVLYRTAAGEIVHVGHYIERPSWPIPPGHAWVRRFGRAPDPDRETVQPDGALAAIGTSDLAKRQARRDLAIAIRQLLEAKARFQSAEALAETESSQELAAEVLRLQARVRSLRQ